MYQKLMRYLPFNLDPVLLISLFSCVMSGVHAQDTDADSASELEIVRSQIAEVKSNIEQARKESDVISEALQNTEMAISEISVNLESIKDKITTSRDKLSQLNIDKKRYEENLQLERGLLANQVRAAYQTGRHDYIKLLLNQENPEIVGRMLAYYNYFNDARAARITTINSTIEDVERLKFEIEMETGSLDELRRDQENKLTELHGSQQQREEIITRLEGFISEQDNQLFRLTKNAEELESLVNDLQRQEDIVHTFEEIPPFNTLKGQLNWPVSGKISNQFGSNRKDGRLNWQGVNILADKGTSVTAISDGRIVYADWFRNMGLLIIIDHGGGYMSLYGHNDRLIKKEGDWILANEEISLVGDTGGQGSSVLYFEIRYKGDPVNPNSWCSL